MPGSVVGGSRRALVSRCSSQTETEDWSFRGMPRLRGSREAVTGTKSTCSGQTSIRWFLS